MELPEVRLCRGLILDGDRDWAPVCWGYSKFWNVEEFHAEKIDWATARIYDKLDGSLCVLWYYNNAWRVSTSGSPDASGEVRADQYNLLKSTKKFSELFWETWEKLEYCLPPSDFNCCLMFELMTPENRIVVPHTEAKLVLHGCRSLSLEDDYEEIDPGDDIADIYGYECVKQFPLQTLDEILTAAKALDPMHAEGFVVVDSKWRRVKIKSPQYVAIHHLRSELTERKMITVVQSGEKSEILSYFPELSALYSKVEERFNRAVSEVERVYEEHREIIEQKEFALKVKDLPYSGALFSVRSKKCPSIRKWFQTQTPEKIEKLL
jgi:tRNA splicing ligase